MEEPAVSVESGQNIPPSAPAFEQLSPIFAQWALTADEDLERVEHGLRGEVGVAQSDRSLRWIKEFEPVMNEQGIYELMRFLRGFVSKMIILSNLDREQARKVAKMNAIGIAKFLFINHTRFNLRLEKYEEIVLEATNFIELTLGRTTDKTTLKWIHPEAKEQIHTIRQDQQGRKPSGLFGLGI